MDLYRILVIAHIIAGSIALIGFWTAAWARKGSPLHKRSGSFYLLAMLAVLLSSVLLTVLIAASGNVGIAGFLAFLVLITGTACWLAWRAIRLKAAPERYFNRWHAGVGVLNLLAGLGTFALGLHLDNALLQSFCWVGVVIGIGMLRKQRNPPSARNWWLREHYGAMLGNGVATHIAFLGIGMRPLIQAAGVEWLHLVPWLLPLAVAAAASVWLDRRYGGTRSSAMPAAQTAAGHP